MSPRLARAGSVIGLLALLELVLLPYYRGSRVPPFDFYEAYLTDAYVWWRDGSFLHPVGWIDYMWNGYPAAVSIQNSAWYVPVGVASAFDTYSPHTAAVLQALHIGFGALGAYVLLRSLGTRHTPALVGLATWFFAPGFFDGAEHADLLRGWAWLPWVLLAASPAWPWQRSWAVPVAAVIFWQMLVGAYPGELVALGYAGSIYVVALLVVTPRQHRGRYATSIAIAALSAGLMACLKFVPVHALGQPLVIEDDRMAFGWHELASVFLPFMGLADPRHNDVSMECWFIPAALLVFVPSAFRLRRVAPWTALLAVAIVFGMPWSPLYSAPLPALDVSRFQSNDFRPIVILAVVVLGCIGLDEAIGARISWRRHVAPAAGAVTLVAVALAATLHSPLWGVGLAGLVVGLALLAVCLTLGPTRRVSAVLAVASVVLPSLLIVGTSQPMWAQDRVANERTYLGAPVDELLSRAASEPLIRRPPRILPDRDDPNWPVPMLSNVGNGAAYSRSFASYGYLNIRNNAVALQQQGAYDDPATRPTFLAFYGAPSAVAPVYGGSPETTRGCLVDGHCTGLTFASQAYSSGEMTFAVTADRVTTVAVNESFYPGWNGTYCADSDARCYPIAPRSGPLNAIVVDLPSGSGSLHLHYTIPAMTTGWWCFGSGVSLAVAFAIGAALVTRRRQKSILRRVTPQFPRGVEAGSTTAPRHDGVDLDLA